MRAAQLITMSGTPQRHVHLDRLGDVDRVEEVRFGIGEAQVENLGAIATAADDRMARRDVPFR